MRKLPILNRKVPASITFKIDVLERIDAVKGHKSRSSYVNDTIDRITKEEDKMGISH
ncbi:MAG: hypothetical protein MIO93_16185 [ANME-2 cluster archaeon]|nr:hypothetical protein [ANME-2 cluster archaeon]